MKTEHFCLKPFEMDPSLETLQIEGYGVREGNNFRLHYTLSGDLAAIALASPAQHPQRLDNLWQTTCFEFFLALPNAARYWEFNLSPAGHWNVYRFENYRAGMQPELAFSDLPFVIKVIDERLLLDLVIDLTKLFSVQQSFELGVTTVLEDQHQQISYWAISHPGQIPDFHLRESFLLRFF